MQNQKNAVCELLIGVLAQNGINYELNGEKPIKEYLTKSMLDTVKAEVAYGFEENEIQMSDAARDKYIGKPTEMKKYVNGLVNNWIRKNPEFNGGVKYIAKNPGSRAGQGDESIKEMRKLLKTQTDPKIRTSIEQAIQERLKVIAPEKVETININVIPEHLRSLVK